MDIQTSIHMLMPDRVPPQGAADLVGRTLYRQVSAQIEALALGGPLGDETMLPAEVELAARLGASRGTVRRAIGDLERAGLLWRRAGKGTFVNPAARLRRVVWSRLAEVAKPDARFHFDFTEFIPDFDGSDRCVEAVADLPEYRRAKTLFITPDNSLEGMRQRALADGKRILVWTYALRRGLLCIDGRQVGAADRQLAATLDGMERFGHLLDYEGLLSERPVDFVVTGAAAVSREGVHFGKGHGYFDLEWGLLSELGLVGQQTPVAVAVHDCQVIDESVPHAPHDASVDVIVTPSAVLRCGAVAKPAGLVWERVPRHLTVDTPYFAEAWQQRALGRGAA